MIAKENRGRADDIDYLERLLSDPSRQSAHSKIGKELARIRRGLSGERTVANILDREFGPSENHLLVHDLRFEDGMGGYVQFDHVLLSRLSRTASIIETKNYSGRISRNEHNEWSVFYGRRAHAIPSPVEQVRRGRDFLRRWLAEHGHDQAFKEIGVFVVVPPDCMIDRSRIGVDIPVMKADNFYQRWVEFGGISTLGKLFSYGVSAKQLRRIGEQLAREHVPASYDWDLRFGFNAPKQVELQLENDMNGPTLALDPLADEYLRSASGQSFDARTLPPAELEPQVVASEPLTLADAADLISSCPAPSHSAAEIALETPPAETPSLRASTKASPPVEVIEGIFERTLPDGRIAFFSQRNAELARIALTGICKGKAQWNPRFQNWLCDQALASQIRSALPSALAEAKLS